MNSQITSCFENYDHDRPNNDRVLKITILFGQSRSFSENHNIIRSHNDRDLKMTIMIGPIIIVIFKTRCFSFLPPVTRSIY